MAPSVVRRTALQAFDDFGVYTLSVFAAMGQSTSELCSSEPRLAVYGKVRLSTSGRVRVAGFALLPTGDAPHFDVLPPDLVEPTLTRRDRCFDGPQPNLGRQ